MSKARITALGFLLLTSSAIAQNLIPNPGLEQYSKLPCDCMHGSLREYIDAWENAASGTPDYIHTKAEESCYASTKSSHWDSYGTETPHGGDGMGMIMTSAHEGSYREYLGVTLDHPLKKGQKYYTEFFVSLGDYCGTATNNMGMLFKTGVFSAVGGYHIIGTPQVNTTTIIEQTKGWYKVSGTFIAEDNYTYVVIGNFFSKENTLTKTMPVAPNYTGEHTYRIGMAAYYIDDFMLRETKIDLTVTGDTMVNSGTTATLIADGGVVYTWADCERPEVIIGGGAELKITMNKKRSFYVYSSGDTATITVNVRKPASAYMQELNGRKVRKGRNITVNSEEITIQVYDKNEIDGDSISLYYGDSLIVSNLALTKKKMSFTIRVDKTKPRQIVLYAENMGRVPPNTACMIVKDGRNDTEVVLQSDFKYCDSLMLTYKEDD